MGDEELVEVYGAEAFCPMEGCGFTFSIENCIEQEECRQMVLYIARLHHRLRHHATTYVDPEIRQIEGLPKALERKELPN